jgi:hypothetical protein
MPRISSHFSTLHCDFFKFPSAPHLLMIVRDADDVVRAGLAPRSSEILPGFSGRWSAPVKVPLVPAHVLTPRTTIQCSER